MARFITIHQQMANVQEQSSFIHYLLLIVIIMEIITLPVLPIIGVAPINIVLLFAVLAIMFNFKQLPVLSPVVTKIILLLLFFDIYDYILGWSLDKDNVIFPMATIRKCIELTLFALACTKPVELKRIIFTISIGITISAMFGLLIYHIGEPFQSIRDWLLQSTKVKSGISGKGMWISGLSGEHFLFGYLIGVAPVIALVCTQLSRFKWIWIILFLLMSYTLYLNAERAALVGALLGVAYLLIRWRLVKTLYVCIGVSLFLAAYVLKPNTEMVAMESSVHGASLTSRFVKTDAGTTERLDWLKAGILSVLEHPFSGVSDQEYQSAFFENDITVVNSPDRKIPYVHNHYVNTGLKIGIIGWMIVFFYLQALNKIFKQIFAVSVTEEQERKIFEGGAIALISVMLVALFHNSGIFFNEPVTVCLTGLLIAIYQALYNQKNSLSSNCRLELNINDHA